MSGYIMDDPGRIRCHGIPMYFKPERGKHQKGVVLIECYYGGKKRFYFFDSRMREVDVDDHELMDVQRQLMKFGII